MLRIAGARCIELRPLLFVAPLLAGCAERDSSTARPVATENQPRASVALRVLVVNEPELAEAINRLRGEWAERSGGELSASAMTGEQLMEKNSIEADVVVFPSRYSGELCVRNWLRPIRPNVLESKEVNINDVFPLIRRELMRWGGEVVFLPLGIDPAMLYPGPREQPGIALIVEAADRESEDRDGFLFDIETMKPRITGLAFMGALKRMQREGDGSEADVSIPVLGFGDRLIAVTSSSRNAASAFKLLTWLAQADTSTQLTRAGSRMLPVRQSLASSPSWYNSDVSADERIETGKRLERLLSAPRCLLVPRIPGVDQYMGALDEAVNSALDGQATPDESLQRAAQRWEEITEAHGRESQRESYLKHLGINE
jgi:hypothetical protein